MPRASLPLSFSDLPDYDLSDYGLDPVPLLGPLQVYLITEGIHHLSQAVTLGLHAGSLGFPRPVLLAEVAPHVLHLLGVLCRQLLQEDDPLVQALVKRGLLHEFVSQVTEIDQLDLMRVQLI